jgi:hypothetical protein
LDFGTVVVGSSKNLTDVITNGSTAAVTLSLQSATQDFQVVSPSLPLSLAPGQQAMVTISFTPPTAGNPAGTISFVGSGSGKIQVELAVSGNSVKEGQLAVNPQAVAFGSVPVGQSRSLSATLNNPGGTTVTLARASVSSAAFQVSGLNFPVTFAPGQSVTMTIVFAPKSAGALNGTIAVSGSASLVVGSAQSGSAPQLSTPISLSIGVTGSGISGASQGQLVLSPAVLTFSGVQVGSEQQQVATLTNSGGASIMVSQATVTGAGFSLTGLSLPLTLGVGASAQFSVAFAPKAGGTVNGAISFTSDASDGLLSLPLSGTAVTAGQLASIPASVNFGAVAVGTSQKQSATLTNTGGSSLTISQAPITGTGFSLSGINLPLTLAAGQTVSYSVIFAPESSASVSGNITFITGGSTLNVLLAGAGLAAGSLSANPASVNLGSVQVGSQQSQSVTLTNGGANSVTVSQASASGAGFSVSGLALPLTLAAGQSTSFSVVFSPVASGVVNGTLAISSNAKNPTLNLSLSGTGVTPGVLTANPSSLTFSGLEVGGSQAQSETLTNSGGSNVTISQITSSGSGFSVGTVNLPTTLGAGQSVTFTVTFSPQSSGTATGELTVISNASTLTIRETGTSSSPGQLSLSPTALNFGSVTVGTGKSQTGTVTASGASVIVTSTTSNSTEFSLTGLSFPLTLAAGQSVSFTVTFSPQTTGAASGVISFASNATSPSSLTVSGTGASAPQHSVSLSWTATPSTVVGYNIYRGAQSGGPYVKINSTPDTSTTYVDNTVVAGSTYYYVATAVDSSGQESAYSNQVQAQIPTP